MSNINWQTEQTPIYTFQNNFFQHYDLLNPVLDSYNQVYSELINIIEKFDLKYPYQTKDPQHVDEQLMIGIQLKNPKIIKPGDDPKLPKTATQAIAEKKDFMCTYKFDATVVIKLKQDNNQIKQMKHFMQTKMEEQEIKDFDKQFYNQLLEKYFQEFQDKFQQVDQIEIPAGEFTFNLPVMTMSVLDPVKYMTPRQKYDNGCNVNERGGDIVLAGIPYLIQNGYSYPYNQPIVAKSTNIQGQLMRADYLYQNDPIYGNFYTSIFLLIQNKSKKDKTLGQEKSQSNDIVLNFKQKIDINFNESDNLIPVSLLFRAYGCNNDVQLLKYCNPQNKNTTNLFFIDLFQEGEIHQKYMGQKRKFTQLEALFEIGKIIAKNVKDQSYEDVFNITQIAQYGLSKYIYPIVIGEESPYCQTLGEICNSIYEASLDEKKCTDRDALYNKRFTMVGAQVVAEMRGKMFDSFKTATRGFINQLDQRSFYDLKDNKANLTELTSQIVNEFSKIFSKTIKKSFTSTQADNIKINKNFNEQKTQHLSISQKREAIIKPSSSAAGAKSVGYEQRKIQKSHFGFICYLTTPEAGENIGRYLSPTIYSYVTIPQGTKKMEDYLKTNKLFVNKREDNKNYMSVKINYQTKGYVEWGKQFRQLYDDLLEFRRSNLFKNPKTGETIKDWKEVKNICECADQVFTTIYCSVEGNEINICTDAGRIIIPVFTKKGKDNRDFVQKLFDGDAMFVCSSMVQFYIIDEWTEDNPNPKTWYMGPSGALALLPGVNPLQNHNKAVRSTYSTSQMKNSQSQCVQNYSNYYLKNMLIINENQRQIIYAPLSDITMWDSPITQMVYMGIMPFTDNQEDAMIISDDFIQRNGFATTSLKTYISQRIDQSEMFQMPTQVRKEYNYSKLNQNQNQITKMGTLVKENDVLISKVKMLDKKQKIDQSVVYDITQDGEFSCVCNVNNYTFNEINNLKSVRIMLARLPSIGDKVASVNAQKSTIGKVLLGCDMPIDEEDTNPIMKRETYGQSLEILLGKYILTKNKLRLQVSQDQPVGDMLEDLGKLQLDKMYRPDQDELFQNPIVLAGPINYTVQKHIVDEKIRYRADQGKIDIISKQSASGKKVQGGLKIGDMERTAISASGAANLLKDFFGRLSSNTQYYICQKCGGTYVHYNKQMQQYECRCCGILLENEVIQNGYSYNGILLNHILFASGAQQNFITDSKQ